MEDFKLQDGNWNYAQIQYETTNKSVSQIAKECGLRVTQVISRASRDGWTRDKLQTVADAAANLLVAQKVAKDARRAAELEAIERVNVAMQAELLVRHRRDIRNAQNICNGMFDELTTADPEDLDLPTRANVLVKLANSMKVFVLLERQAYGVQTALQEPETPVQTDTTPADAALEALLNKFASVLEKDMGPAQVVTPQDEPPTLN